MMAKNDLIRSGGNNPLALARIRVIEEKQKEREMWRKEELRVYQELMRRRRR